jgi:hypothetical protein
MENAGIENREYETRPENFLTPRLARNNFFYACNYDRGERQKRYSIIAGG